MGVKMYLRKKKKKKKKTAYPGKPYEGPAFPNGGGGEG